MEKFNTYRRLTLTKDDFIMPKFRKRNGDVNFDFFFCFKIDGTKKNKNNKLTEWR